MSGNKWWSTKVGAKLLSDLVTFSIFFSNIPLGFHNSIRAVPSNYLRVVLAAKLVISGIFSSTSLIYRSISLYSAYFTTSFFTPSPSLIKSARVVSNFPIFNLSILLFKLLKPLAQFFNLSISNLSTLDFKLAKSTFLANFYLSIPVTFFKYSFVE